MMLVEVILIAVFLATVAIGTSYFFAQTKATMTSSSQVMECQTIAKQALESVVSLGTRLYGYKVSHRESAFRYEPLFIKYDTSEPNNIKHVNSGSELSFPPQMYKTLYENLGVSPPTQDPETNTGVPLIGATYPFEISTSTLIVNSVNALQYLYNSDNGFFTENSGMGKMYTSNSGEISTLLKSYEDRFDLENIKFYIRVAPIDLTEEKTMTSPPPKILTRPRFHKSDGVQLSPALEVLGDPEIGFEITVNLEYTQSDQDYTCDASHRFAHQIKPIVKRSQSISVSMTDLVTGADIDLKNNQDLNSPPLTPAVPADLKLTSCDTHGTDYNDITMTIDFNGIGESQQIGTVILCQMNSYCQSYGDAIYNSCSPESGRWQRCHKVDPKPGSDQSWTYKSELTSSQVLAMTFEDMKPNRRYELVVGEFSMAGHNLRKKMVSKFYIDAIRPYIKDETITNDAVGLPKDKNRGGRNYTHSSFINWAIPDDSMTNKWLQCNQDTVEFTAHPEDQFTHNLEKCELKGKREDGTNKGTGAATSPTLTSDCGGELGSIAQGRQTITFIPSDTCGKNSKTEDLVWDTDLPSSFEAQEFPEDPKWFYSTDKSAYLIKTEIPAKDTAGKFPKHYSVDCDDKFIGSRMRKDGNSEQLDCELETSNPNHDDGCNPIKLGTKYYHVCGGTEVCKDIDWAVYTPLKSTCTGPACKCTYVQCEPPHSCCRAADGTCNGVGDQECGEPNTRDCTNPKGGRQTSADEVPSGCPPLGLNDCSYALPCEATSPCSETGPTSACNGTREGGSCSYSKSGTCVPNNTGWNLSCNTSGSYAIGCDSGPCTVGCSSQCRIPCTHTCYSACHGSHTSTSCDSNGQNCTSQQVACNHISCNPHNCHSCHQTEYQSVSGTHTVSFSGQCGVPRPTPGCVKKPRVVNNDLLQERCDLREPLCGAPPTGVTPPVADCPPGDTWPSNPLCTPDCVKKHGKACCTAAEGGTCTGELCADNCVSPGTCHVRDLNDGICRPTCEYLAKQAGYGGYGSDGVRGTSDDPFTGTWDHGLSICTDLNASQIWGSTSWLKIPLIENIEPQEARNGGEECCGRQDTIINGECGLIGCNAGDEQPVSDSHGGGCWECKGINRGSDDGPCPINGVCDTTDPAKKGCSAGKAQPPNPDIANDTWKCEGLHGGDKSSPCGICDSTADCCSGDVNDPGQPNHSPHCPKCTTDKDNPCDTGTVSDLNEISPLTWTWKCSNKGKTINCSAGAKTNGICNTSGTRSPPPCLDGNEEKADPTWVCKGIGTGAIDSGLCPLNGKCGNPCDAGLPDPFPVDLTKTWTCKGLENGTDDGPCSTSVNGVCDNTAPNGCSSGNPDPSSPDTINGSWICKGLHEGKKSGLCCGSSDNACCDSSTTCCDGDKHPAEGGTNNNCPVDGVCGNPCDVGLPDPSPVDLTKTWICKGINEGKASPSCPRHGICGGDYHSEKCKIGTYKELSRTSEEIRWRCEGLAEGNASTVCTHNPIHGECSPTGCSKGQKEEVTDHPGCWKCKTACACTEAQDEGPCPRDGVCNSNGTGCIVGTYQSIGGTSKCLGLHNGNNTTCGTSLSPCECTTPGDSTCGTDLSKEDQLHPTCCAKGYYHPHPGDTTEQYKWTCKPTVGGTTVCNQKLRCEPQRCKSGKCDTPNSKCLVGQKKTISATEWQCLKTSGLGTCTDATCKPECDSSVDCCHDDKHPDKGGTNNNCKADGVCNYHGYRCKSGHSVMVGNVKYSNTNGHNNSGVSYWDCEGPNEGARVTCVKCHQPDCTGIATHPPRDGFEDGGCAHGEASSGSDEGGTYVWRCGNNCELALGNLGFTCGHGSCYDRVSPPHTPFGDQRNTVAPNSPDRECAQTWGEAGDGDIPDN